MYEHCIGVLLPDSILIQPELLCLEFAIGCNWLCSAPCLVVFILVPLNLNTSLGCYATHVELSVVHMKPSLSSTFYLAPSTGIFILLLSVASSLTEESCRHSMQQVWGCLAGDGLSSLFFMHQVDLRVWLKQWKGGCSLQEASSPAGDLCSRSNKDLFQWPLGICHIQASSSQASLCSLPLS